MNTEIQRNVLELSTVIRDVIEKVYKEPIPEDTTMKLTVLEEWAYMAENREREIENLKHSIKEFERKRQDQIEVADLFQGEIYRLTKQNEILKQKIEPIEKLTKRVEDLLKRLDT